MSRSDAENQADIGEFLGAWSVVTLILVGSFKEQSHCSNWTELDTVCCPVQLNWIQL